MYVITGATGNLGSVVVKELVERGEDVIVVTRDSDKAWKLFGDKVTISETDILDTSALNQVFSKASHLFILNPPADTSTNIEEEERATIKSILHALQDLTLKNLVVESTMGARKGDDIADLGSLYELEQGIKALPYRYNIIRPAVFMSNWLAYIDAIKKSGELPCFYPEHLKIPMVAPQDIGEFAVELLLNDTIKGTHTIIGPLLYTPLDVAQTFSKVLGKNIKLKIIPKDQWREAYKSFGFSEEAANSFANLAEITGYGHFDIPNDARIGNITLEQFLYRALE